MSSQNGDNFSVNDHLHPWTQYSITYHTFPEQYEESIPRFSFTLRKHQTEALAWLIQRETNPPGGGNMRGGILADDMGLGKTIELLSLIVLDKVQPQTFEKKWDFQHLTHQGYCPDRTLLQQIQPSMGFGSTSTSSNSHSTFDALPRSSGTLIIAPKGILSNWMREASKAMTRGHCLKLLFHHNSLTEKQIKEAYGGVLDWQKGKKTVDLFTQCDLCLTTYSEVRIEMSNLIVWINQNTDFQIVTKKEQKKRLKGRGNDSRNLLDSSKSTKSIIDDNQIASIINNLHSTLTPKDLKKFISDGEKNFPLFIVFWRRIALDEAHNIKNKDAEQTKAALGLYTDRRWALTGTPIQNSIEDVKTLCSFLQFNTGNQEAMVGCILRRTKATVLKDELPAKIFIERNITLTHLEREFYLLLQHESMSMMDSVEGGQKSRNNGMTVLEAITRMQQASIHPALVVNSIQDKGHEILLVPESFMQAYQYWGENPATLPIECAQPPLPEYALESALIESRPLIVGSYNQQTPSAKKEKRNEMGIGNDIEDGSHKMAFPPPQSNLNQQPSPSNMPLIGQSQRPVAFRNTFGNPSSSRSPMPMPPLAPLSVSSYQSFPQPSMDRQNYAQSQDSRPSFQNEIADGMGSSPQHKPEPRSFTAPKPKKKAAPRKQRILELDDLAAMLGDDFRENEKSESSSNSGSNSSLSSLSSSYDDTDMQALKRPRANDSDSSDSSNEDSSQENTEQNRFHPPQPQKLVLNAFKTKGRKSAKPKATPLFRKALNPSSNKLSSPSDSSSGSTSSDTDDSSNSSSSSHTPKTEPKSLFSKAKLGSLSLFKLQPKKQLSLTGSETHSRFNLISKKIAVTPQEHSADNSLPKVEEMQSGHAPLQEPTKPASPHIASRVDSPPAVIKEGAGHVLESPSFTIHNQFQTEEKKSELFSSITKQEPPSSLFDDLFDEDESKPDSPLDKPLLDVKSPALIPEPTKFSLPVTTNPTIPEEPSKGNLFDDLFEDDEPETLDEPIKLMTSPPTQINQPLLDVKSEENQDITLIDTTPPDTQIHQPDTQIHQPDTQIHQPDTQIHQPDTQIHQPDTQIHQPDTQIDQPDTNLSQIVPSHEKDLKRRISHSNSEPDTPSHSPVVEYKLPRPKKTKPKPRKEEESFSDHQTDSLESTHSDSSLSSLHKKKREPKIERTEVKRKYKKKESASQSSSSSLDEGKEQTETSQPPAAAKPKIPPRPLINPTVQKIKVIVPGRDAPPQPNPKTETLSHPPAEPTPQTLFPPQPTPLPSFPFPITTQSPDGTETENKTPQPNLLPLPTVQIHQIGIPFIAPPPVPIVPDVKDQSFSLSKFGISSDLAYLFIRHCAICWNWTDSLVITPCHHAFCRGCWQKYTTRVMDERRYQVRERKNDLKRALERSGKSRKRYEDRLDDDELIELRCPCCGVGVNANWAVSLALLQAVHTLTSSEDGRALIGMVDENEESSGDVTVIKTSSKLRMLLEYINEMPKDEKIVVFSKWTKCLDLIEPLLQKIGYQFCRFDGTQNVNQQRNALEQLSAPNVKVMLASLQAGGVGLNLVAANHVVLVDRWWNPFIEDQAVDRVYRIGQEREVSVVHLIVQDSIEQRIEKLQLDKRQSAEELLRDDKKGLDERTQLEEVSNKLSARDMSFLLKGRYPDQAARRPAIFFPFMQPNQTQQHQAQMYAPPLFIPGDQQQFLPNPSLNQSGYAPEQQFSDGFFYS